MTQSQQANVICVGGVGGSGTRVLAELLRRAGVFIGDDLNVSLDSLLAALCFNRLSALSEGEDQFSRVSEIFYRRMQGEQALQDAATRSLLEMLAETPRQQHKLEFLQERVRRYFEVDADKSPAGRRWGWKLPPSLLVLERHLQFDPSLKFVQLIRHGLDMAFSSNQNQLKAWGPTLLGRPVEVTPRDSLAYWCEAQRRFQALQQRYPDNIRIVRFEDLCAQPAAEARRFLDFLGLSVSPEVIDTYAAWVRTPDSVGRYRQHDLDQFNRADLEMLEAQAYGLR